MNCPNDNTPLKMCRGKRAYTHYFRTLNVLGSYYKCPKCGLTYIDKDQSADVMKHFLDDDGGFKHPWGLKI